MNEILFLVFAFSVKHFVFDFLLQVKYQYSDKGIYGHPGGILHAFFHGVGTYVCLVWVAPIIAIYLAVADMIAHYHIDWAKTNLKEKLNWRPMTHDQFWWLLGLDQFLHALTYIVLIGFVI